MYSMYECVLQLFQLLCVLMTICVKRYSTAHVMCERVTHTYVFLTRLSLLIVHPESP